MKVKTKRLSPDEYARVGNELVEMSGDIVDPDRAPLTQEDRRTCQAVVERGFWYFEEMGWDREKERTFLSRHNVRREIDRLQGIINDAEGLKQRTLFFNQIRMLQMLPAALVIVQNTLLGPAKPDERPRPVPTESQYLAARDVIEWCGLSERRGGLGVSINVNNTINIPQIDRTKPIGDDEDADTDRYKRESVMQRTRVRTALDRIVDVLGIADDEVSALEERRAQMSAKKKKKKR